MHVRHAGAGDISGSRVGIQEDPMDPDPRVGGEALPGDAPMTDAAAVVPRTRSIPEQTKRRREVRMRERSQCWTWRAFSVGMDAGEGEVGEEYERGKVIRAGDSSSPSLFSDLEARRRSMTVNSRLTYPCRCNQVDRSAAEVYDARRGSHSRAGQGRGPAVSLP